MLAFLLFLLCFLKGLNTKLKKYCTASKKLQYSYFFGRPVMLGINEKTNGIFPSYSFSFDNWFLFLLGLFSFTQGCIYFHIPKDYYRLVRANSQSSVMVKIERRKRLWRLYYLCRRSARSKTCSKLSSEEYIFLLKLCICSLNWKI